MRLLGDEYVKSEFRAHRSVDNPVHIIGFLTEWQSYAQQLDGDNWREARMDKGKIDKMSGASSSSWAFVTSQRDCPIAHQQLGQLYELMQSIRQKELQENDPESQRE
ncbi:MAG: acetate non-utilizing protein 9 [Bogoriella megaspora]|nr:MAG: acetate non-utilizing protein 9 [Bogoriella megaspora]